MVAYKEKSQKLRLDIITERFLIEIIKVISSDSKVSKRMLSNINKLLDEIDLDYYYEKNNEIAALLKTISIIVNIKRFNHIFDTNGAIVELESNLRNESYEDILNNTIIPTIESSAKQILTHKCEELNKTISIYLQYGYILTAKNDIVSAVNDIESSYGSELVDNIMAFRGLLNKVNEFFRGTDSSNIFSGLLHLIDNEYVDSLMDTYKRVTNPSTRLITGIKAFNRCLSPRGGFEPGLYFFYAIINSWKSALMEQLAVMLKKFNNHIFEEKKFKNSHLIPTILLITLENSIHEDNERLFKMFTYTDLDNVPNIEALKNMWNTSFFKMDSGGEREDGRCINIAMFRLNNTNELKYKFTSDDIVNLIETLKEEGYETIACLIDYFEMMSPRKEDERKELRLQYASRSFELLEISKRYDIPVITPHQFNRDADKLINEARQEGKNNYISRLGASYIGESYAVQKYATFSAAIGIETNPVDKKQYLGISRIKSRYQSDKEWETFYHEIKNGICLEYDVDKPEYLSKKSIAVDNDSSVEKSLSESSAIGSRGRTIPVSKNNEQIKIVSKNKTDDLISALAKTVARSIIYFKDSNNILRKESKSNEFIVRNGILWEKATS